jgi:S-adenosylmethionine:tRNA ribosyltransferase-isomerase
LNRDPIKSDYTTYQTVFAEEVGAVAAPTAALHFEKRELNLLQQKGISTHKMTLHVSAGTFLPVTVENVLEHPMHNEIFYYDKQDVHYLFETDFLIPVGTTSLRMAESLYWMGLALLHNKDVSFSLDKLFPYQSQFECVDKNEVKNALLSYLDSHPNQRIKASTRLMIIPGYKPQLCKGLITNFHQPCSTLVMLVASLIGNDWHKVYQSALENDYRFLSYGDSSLLIW